MTSAKNPHEFIIKVVAEEAHDNHFVRTIVFRNAVSNNIFNIYSTQQFRHVTRNGKQLLNTVSLIGQPNQKSQTLQNQYCGWLEGYWRHRVRRKRTMVQLLFIVGTFEWKRKDREREKGDTIVKWDGKGWRYTRKLKDKSRNASKLSQKCEFEEFT